MPYWGEGSVCPRPNARAASWVVLLADCEISMPQPLSSSSSSSSSPSSAPTPSARPHDPAHLAALRRAALLDGAPDVAVDRLTRLATTILHAPVALVTLIETDRQIFVSSVGLPEPWASQRETPLSHSICQHTVASAAPLIIADARDHPLTRDNLAIPDLGVVAYVGLPLVSSDGDALGSFCVIDHRPRVWTDGDIAILRDLAASVMTAIELRAAAEERVALLAQARRDRASAERAHEAVERERARLRAIFQQAPALIALLVGPDHVFEYVNPVYERVVGRASAALLGRSVRDALPDLAGQGSYEALDAVYTTGTPYRSTEALVRLNRACHGDEGGDESGNGGETRAEAYVTFVYHPLRDAEGVIQGILVNGVEVTEQVRARQRSEALGRQVADERDRLRQVLDVLPEGVLLVDARGRCTLANQAARDILGQEWTGRPLVTARDHADLGARRLDGAPLARRDLAVTRALGGTVVRGAQILLRNAESGTDIPVLMNGAPLRAVDGVSSGAVVVFQDITTLRNFERARDTLLATVSHDLKNPLTAIQGLAELSQEQAARGDTPSSARMAARQGGIVTAATQMTALLNELLDAMQLQMGQPLALDRRPADLVELVHRVVDHQREIAERPIRVIAAVPELICPIDVDRIERVVGNLVSNAIKYSPRGKAVTVRATREAGPEGVWAVLAVRDRGVGIPAEDLPHVFDRFYRGENVGGVQGTGIGLASVREIVEQHGGTVAIVSREGGGTTITVRLPAPVPAPS